MTVSAKEQVRRLLNDLPDDATLEDIQYHLYVCQQVARGMADAESGRTVDQVEMDQKLDRWIDR